MVAKNLGNNSVLDREKAPQEERLKKEEEKERLHKKKEKESFHYMIPGQYLKNMKDLLSFYMVSKKNAEAVKMLHYNPVPFTNDRQLEMFPNLETFCVYIGSSEASTSDQLSVMRKWLKNKKMAPQGKRHSVKFINKKTYGDPEDLLTDILILKSCFPDQNEEINKAFETITIEDKRIIGDKKNVIGAFLIDVKPQDDIVSFSKIIKEGTFTSNGNKVFPQVKNIIRKELVSLEETLKEINSSSVSDDSIKEAYLNVGLLFGKDLELCFEKCLKGNLFDLSKIPNLCRIEKSVLFYENARSKISKIPESVEKIIIPESVEMEGWCGLGNGKNLKEIVLYNWKKCPQTKIRTLPKSPCKFDIIIYGKSSDFEDVKNTVRNAMVGTKVSVLLKNKSEQIIGFLGTNERYNELKPNIDKSSIVITDDLKPLKPAPIFDVVKWREVLNGESSNFYSSTDSDITIDFSKYSDVSEFRVTQKSLEEVASFLLKKREARKASDSDDEEIENGGILIEKPVTLILPCEPKLEFIRQSETEDTELDEDEGDYYKAFYFKHLKIKIANKGCPLNIITQEGGYFFSNNYFFLDEFDFGTNNTLVEIPSYLFAAHVPLAFKVVFPKDLKIIGTDAFCECFVYTQEQEKNGKKQYTLNIPESIEILR